MNNELIPTFFCVPDITGFTKFISTADIDFSTEVIPAILRKIIDANLLKMNVAEVEGDAIFFYKNGRLPSVVSVAKQCVHIYETFVHFIEKLKISRPEKYEKYLSNNQLGLKIIIHYGYSHQVKIKGRLKLLGEDVIIAHKLLKNNIPESNYILLTDKYISKIKTSKQLHNYFHWEELFEGIEEYDHIGKVSYKYLSLDKFNVET